MPSDCLLVHRERLADLPDLCAPLQESQVILYADEPAYEALSGRYPVELLRPATPESYGTEFLDYKMAIKTVENVKEAVLHIYACGSGHSECIVTEDAETADFFTKAVDAACGVCQCTHFVYRWGSVWFGSRNWYQYPETACSWSDGIKGDDYLQVDCGR